MHKIDQQLYSEHSSRFYLGTDLLKLIQSHFEISTKLSHFYLRYTGYCEIFISNQRDVLTLIRQDSKLLK